MSYTSQNSSLLAAIGAAFASAFSAIANASDSIVADRQRATVTLLQKSDEELARMGLARARVAQDVHAHLYYS